MDKNNRDDFFVDIRHSLGDFFEYFLVTHPLELILEGTLSGKFIAHHGYMKNGGWSETHFHFYHDHEQKNSTIYQAQQDYVRERGLSGT